MPTKSKRLPLRVSSEERGARFHGDCSVASYNRVRYYMERRDPGFEAKMKEVLLVYGEVATAPADGLKTAEEQPLYTVAVNEKPGTQALVTTAPDLPPVAGEHPAQGRGGITLPGNSVYSGRSGPAKRACDSRVERRHRSREFIQPLGDLDPHYPKGAVIHLMLDTHSAQIPKEIQSYLASKPNRFRYVHTPKHSSWLNLVMTMV